jgi:hypothetical protein
VTEKARQAPALPTPYLKDHSFYQDDKLDDEQYAEGRGVSLFVVKHVCFFGHSGARHDSVSNAADRRNGTENIADNREPLAYLMLVVCLAVILVQPGASRFAPFPHGTYILSSPQRFMMLVVKSSFACDRRAGSSVVHSAYVQP